MRAFSEYSLGGASHRLGLSVSPVPPTHDALERGTLYAKCDPTEILSYFGPPGA